MSAEKRRRLEAAVAAIQRRWGHTSLQRSSAVAAAPAGAISTGFALLDEALGGGIPRGRISELLGFPSAGMTTLALSIIAQAQAEGDIAAYIDLGSTFDPAYAAGMGVLLPTLVLVRPRSSGDALSITQSLATSGGIGVLVFDALPLVLAERHGPRQLAATLRRMLAPLTGSPCALLFLTPLAFDAALPEEQLDSLSLPSDASLRLLVARERWIKARRDVVGAQARVTVLRNRLAAAGRQVSIAISFGGGDVR